MSGGDGRWPRFASCAGVVLMGASLVFVLIGIPHEFAGLFALVGFFLLGFDIGSSAADEPPREG